MKEKKWNPISKAPQVGELHQGIQWEGEWPSSDFNDFKVDILEFEGKLDPNEFLEWMQTVKRIFEYKEILAEKKVKLVALKLRKYASL